MHVCCRFSDTSIMIVGTSCVSALWPPPFSATNHQQRLTNSSLFKATCFSLRRRRGHLTHSFCLTLQPDHRTLFPFYDTSCRRTKDEGRPKTSKRRRTRPPNSPALPSASAPPRYSSISIILKKERTRAHIDYSSWHTDTAHTLFVSPGGTHRK